jgi:hypothetical protein
VPRFLFARGQLRSAQGRLQEALDDFLECGQRSERLRLVRRINVHWGAEAARPRGARERARGAAARR